MAGGRSRGGGLVGGRIVGLALLVWVALVALGALPPVLANAAGDGLAVRAAPTDSAACVPRPPVRVSATDDPATGTLMAQVTAGLGLVRELRFTRLDNAVITLAGQAAIRAGATVTPRTPVVTFVVGRSDTRAPVHVALVVVDDCGEWTTFVGRGVGGSSPPAASPTATPPTPTPLTPTPTAIPLTPTPTPLTPTTTPSATPPSPPRTSLGVPSVSLDYRVGVADWWATHPFNPRSASYVTRIDPAGAVVVDATSYGNDLQAAIDSLPPEGGTVRLGPGVFGRATVVGRSHVALVGAGQDATVLRGIEVYGCPAALSYSPYVAALYRRDPAALACYLHPAHDILVRDLTFDGDNLLPVYGDHYMTNLPVFLRTVRDVVFERVSFRNVQSTDSWHPGYVSGNVGTDNVWCRFCTFSGGFRYGWFLDGARGSGVVESTFVGQFKSGAVDWLTNDDATVDLDGDGTIEIDEERTARYVVVAENRFEGIGYQAVAMTAWQSLVTQNVVTTPIDRLVTLAAKCSSRFYRNGNVYRMYDDVVTQNSLTRARFVVQADGTNAANCSADDPDGPLVQLYRGRVGQYQTLDNCIAERPAFVSVTNEIGPVDGPSVVDRNELGATDCLSRRAR
ncbi:MAG: hypothetical protein U0893_23470 [Chloroflexota bacterium]